jgi:hypothetical protein
MISRAVAGWQLSAPVFFTSAGLVVEPVHELLISNPLELRAPVASALTERASRPLVSNRTLRGSEFASTALGPFDGFAYAVRSQAV